MLLKRGLVVEAGLCVEVQALVALLSTRNKPRYPSMEWPATYVQLIPSRNPALLMNTTCPRVHVLAIPQGRE